jgi:hypothetical protein
VYRVHSDEPSYSKENSRIYGWTVSKKVLKGFFKQRDRSKYYVHKTTGYEIGEFYSHNDMSEKHMISLIKLKSNNTSNEFSLFMTAEELEESEVKIRRIFTDLSRVSNIDKSKIPTYVRMVLNLKEKYTDSLYFIGYRPPEIQSMFDSVDNENDLYSLSKNNLLKLDMLYSDDVFRLIIYSLESFIKVLKNDL